MKEQSASIPPPEEADFFDLARRYVAYKEYGNEVQARHAYEDLRQAVLGRIEKIVNENPVLKKVD